MEGCQTATFSFLLINFLNEIPHTHTKTTHTFLHLHAWHGIKGKVSFEISHIRLIGYDTPTWTRHLKPYKEYNTEREWHRGCGSPLELLKILSRGDVIPSRW